MPEDFLKKYLNKMNDLFEKIDFSGFETFVNELESAFQRGSRIFVFGNGGSAMTASHFACDLNKGVSYGKDKKFKVICLNDSIPTLLAYANDVSYDDVFSEQLKNLMEKGDLVIGVSASGNSSNVLRAIEYANTNGAKTFGVTGFGGGKLGLLAGKSIILESDDMQKVEDMHVILFHAVMQYFCAGVKLGAV